MDEANRLAVVITTTETKADADRIARELVERHLAACVQVEGPITSHYGWAGKLQAEQEYRLMIKTRRSVWESLRDKLAEIHPYEEPEIILLDVPDAAPGYLSWVVDQTS